jgi:hypothetical protein
LGCRGSGFPLYLPKDREDAASILNARREKKKEKRRKKKEEREKNFCNFVIHSLSNLTP